MRLNDYILLNEYIVTNFNRAAILYLLRKVPNNEMQTERISFHLGLSHSTVRYHLNILHRQKIVEVRKMQNRGLEMVRSVWGLNSINGTQLENLFEKIDRKFDTRKLEKAVKMNKKHR